MRKLIFFVSACALLAFTGCSSNETDSMGTGNPAVPENGALTVLTSGVTKIPLTVPKGTTSVSVSYEVGGETRLVSVPFVQTDAVANSSMVSGYITFYSATPTTISVYAEGSTQPVAENILLSGRTLGQETVAVRGSEDKTTRVDAYFFIRYDETVVGELGGDSHLYYPQDKDGGSVFNGTNKGTVETDLSKTGVDGLEWKVPAPETGVEKYIYSKDGSATAPLIIKVPQLNAIKMKDGQKIDTDKYKVIWYLVKKHSDGKWHVDGVLVPKDATSITPLPGEGDLDDTELPSTPEVPDDNVDKTVDGIYHDAGVVLCDRDGDKDYNDVVIDYDVEARFPKDGNYPYVKIIMHLRALSDKNIDKVGIDFLKINKYICPNDDMHITFQGIACEETPNTDDDYHYNIPDFSGCELQPGVSGNLRVEVSNMQWLRTNGHGWFKLDENGFYNVTQKGFNGKPFATVSVSLYPDTDREDGVDVEQEIANIISVVGKHFVFDGDKADYIIAPVLTPHVAEGYKFSEAFPNYPADGWWKNTEEKTNFDVTKVVDVNRGY